jgi:UDP-3-O-[3-hydroxymyristoyl] glucosamine N-acyltransferase
MTAGRNVHADNNVSAGYDVTAGQDVIAGRNVHADNNVSADYDVTAGRDMTAGRNVHAYNDLSAGYDVNAGRDVNVYRNANVGSNLDVGGNTYLGGQLHVAGPKPNKSSSQVAFGGNRLENIGKGKASTDAVNVGQLEGVEDEARRGIAIANALNVILPDPGRDFRLTAGGGFFAGETALGVTGAGRVNDDVALYFGIGSDTNFEEVGGNVGVSYQW